MTEPTSSNFLKTKAKKKERIHPGVKIKQKVNKGGGKKKKNRIGIVLAVLLIFFVLQFLSHTFSFMGKNSEKSSFFLKTSSLVFPIDPKPSGDYGFELLKKNRQTPDAMSLAESISYFKRSLAVNMLYYIAHLNLGKAYIYRNHLDHTSYDQALTAFKRAALVRGSNIRVSMDTLTVLLSMWPFLPEQDKDFCTALLGKSIRRFSREDFNSLLDVWGLYSRDAAFFKGALKKNPENYRKVAEKLFQLEVNMEARQRFLSKYAAHILADLQKIYRHRLAEQPPDPGLQEKLKGLLGRLNNQKIMGYYLINPVRQLDTEKYREYEKERILNQKKYFELKKGIILNILELFFVKGDWQKDRKIRTELETYIRFYLDDLFSIDDLKEFNDFLTAKGYFALSASSLKVFYLEQLNRFKNGRYDEVISGINNFTANVAYVKKEDMKNYADILLLLTDAYISFRLLLKAMETVKKIETHDYNITDIYWRKMQIERVIGADDEDENERERKKEQYELITGSRRIRLDSPVSEKTVYLIKNNEKEKEKEIEIQPGDSLKKRIKDFHLLQVIKDGRLFYEAYVSKLEFPVRIPIPIKGKYSKYILHIELL